MEVRMKLEDIGSTDITGRPSPIPAEYLPVFDQSSQGDMARPQVALAPSHLATPPMLWTPHDVKSWLEFCVKEFSLRPVSLDKFDLNGKALLLLTRTDFIERAPHAGDILYNVFQRLLQQEGPAYLRSPIFLPAPAHFISPGAETLPRPLPAQSARSLYIPIRPQPQAPVCSSSATCSTSGSLIFSVDEDNSAVGPGVPASMLSPAPSEKCSSDADSANNESGHSPHGSDHEMDYEESMNFDPGLEIKCDTSDQNDDGVCRLLWEFIYQLLQDNKWSELVSWESVDDLTFRIQNPTNLADAWGKQKNRSNMTYEKLSRALRYYYKMNIIKKVQGKRLTYKFLQHPAKIRKGQRGARPHSSKGLTPRESDTEPSSTEGITPDSSTFLPSRTTSPPASLNALAAASHEYSSNLTSPKREYISDEPQEISTERYDDKGNHFLRSCVDIKSVNQIQSPFTLHDAASLGPSKIAQNTIRAHSVSPGKHLLAMQICQDRFCNVNEKGESNTDSAECTSQLTRLNASPEMLRRPWTFPKSETNSINMSSMSLTNEPFRDDCSMKLTSPNETLRFFDFSERKFSRQKSEQELARDRDRYTLLPESPLCVSNSLRNVSPLQFSTTKSHNGILPSILYSGDSFNHRHPSSYSRSFNQTTAHSSYTHDQKRPSQTSPGGYKRPQHNEFIDHPQAIFSYPPDLSPQGPQDSFQIKHILKQESYDQVQEEPEDLSMKQATRPDGLGKKVKSESDIPLVTRLKDVNRESPRSCSADSAYGSDRADFGKDASVGGLHE